MFFRRVHGGRLIYNTCWEDPRIDRRLLGLDNDSRVVVITSAGCNALDYLLDDPRAVHAVDVNYRQNALMHLKLALLRKGGHEDLFAMFGRGRHERHRELYDAVRDGIPPYARTFWDRKIDYFSGAGLRRSFYFHGTAGEVAWLLGKLLLNVKRGLRPHVGPMLEAQSLAEQREIYQRVEPILWGRLSRWLMKQPVLMTMMGVPRQQVRLIDRHHPLGLAGYVRDKVRAVLTEVGIADNYFWRVYMTGEYTPTCCPNYLRPEHFRTLGDRGDRVATHTCTVTEFLRDNPGRYTHYILLDHQDWLAGHDPEALAEEWELILANSRPGTKVLMRSAGLDLGFLPRSLDGRVRFLPDVTEPLHRVDRVGTYGSLHLGVVQ